MLSVDAGFPMVIALGPEGGLADDERQQMIDGGFIPIRLAPAVLRFETAGIAERNNDRGMTRMTDR